MSPVSCHQSSTHGCSVNFERHLTTSDCIKLHKRQKEKCTVIHTEEKLLSVLSSHLLLTELPHQRLTHFISLATTSSASHILVQCAGFVKYVIVHTVTLPLLRMPPHIKKNVVNKNQIRFITQPSYHQLIRPSRTSSLAALRKHVKVRRKKHVFLKRYSEI